MLASPFAVRVRALTARRPLGFTPAMIEKTYRPADVEARIDAASEAAGAFRAGRPERIDARPYCIVIPPPNVTGTLHMALARLAKAS
jgi:hypothetical protein